MDKLPDYERERLKRIEENKKRMEALGLHKMADSLMGAVLKSRNMNKEKSGKRKVVHEDEEYVPTQDDVETSSSGEEDNDEDFSPSIRRAHLMAGPVATSAGSSGGAQPPQDPRGLASHCESAHETAPAKKRKSNRGRGKAKGHDIALKVAREGRRPIRFDYQNKTWKAIGDDAAAYDSTVGMHTRDIVPPIYNEWDDVPSHLKTLIQERMLEWFDIDYNYDKGLYRRVVDRDAAGRYSDWKTRLYKHFNKELSVGDLQTARNNPPPHFHDNSLWGPACDLFMTEEWQKKSNRNKRNRTGSKYVSYHGRICYSQHREKMKKRETQVAQPYIENWKEMHVRGDTWANPEAEATYHQLKLKSSSTQTPVDEVVIMEQVFGRRRGHMTGVGAKLANVSSSQSNNAAAMPPMQDVEEMRKMRDEVSQMYSLMKEMMGRYAPDVQMSMPTFVSARPSDSVHVPTNNDEGEDDLIANSLDED